MIAAQTPRGKKNFILRGAWTPRGKVNIAQVRATSPDGDLLILDNTAPVASFTLSAVPSSVSGAGASMADITIITNEVVISQTGGAGAVSYSWAKTSGAETWTIESPLSNRTRFEALEVFEGGAFSAVFTCTATDSAGRTATKTVAATATNYGGGL